MPDTEFRLDGGAMFGVVPRVLWERVSPSDEQNRVRLTCNCLFIDTGTEKILIETGIGEKWSAKEVSMYGIHRERPFAESLFEITGCKPEDITIVVNTHLHFDHAGGNTVARPLEGSGLPEPEAAAGRFFRDDRPEHDSPGDAGGADARAAKAAETAYQRGQVVGEPIVGFIPQFRNARYLVSKTEFLHAEAPHERDRASYLPENWQPMIDSQQLELMPDTYEPVPGLAVEQVRGHSETMQTIRLTRGGETLFGFFDMVPTRHHVPLPWIMAYDLFPTETLEFKKRVLPQALEEDWICHFYHDVDAPLCRLAEIDGKIKAVSIWKK